MLFKLLCIVLLFVTSNIFAESYKNITSNFFSVHLSMVRLFDLENPACELSFEFKPASNFSTQIDIGPLMSDMFIVFIGSMGKSEYHHSGYRIGAQFKYWIHKESEHTVKHSVFWAINPFYIKNDYTPPVDFYYSDSIKALRSPDSLPWYTDTIRVQKEFYGMNVLFGYQLNYKRLVVRPYMGIGIRHRYAGHFDKKYPNDKETDIIWNLFDLAGNSWMPNFDINFTVGYLF